MNSAPHLLNEDREEFARILDEALRTAGKRPDDTVSGTERHLNTEQLRTMALSASAAIAACATAEYQHYVQLRTELRAPAATSPGGPAHGEEHDTPSGGGLDPATATTMAEATETTGAGLAAMVAVLVPVLAGVAALLFLLIGYVLRTVSPEKAAAQPLISVGWVFAALTAAGSLVAMGGLVITALRNGSSAQDRARGELDEALALARDAWRHALLERGLLPFLREALTDPAPRPERSPERYVPRSASEPGSRIPTLGYSRPDFSSPDGDSRASRRPRYSSPDFTSPEYGGPEAERE